MPLGDSLALAPLRNSPIKIRGEALSISWKSLLAYLWRSALTYSFRYDSSAGAGVDIFILGMTPIFLIKAFLIGFLFQCLLDTGVLTTHVSIKYVLF